jgi:Subtilase family
MALIATGIAASTIAMAMAPTFGANVRNSEWWLSELGVRQAWTSTRGSGVTVAVLSDGVDASQADLTGSVTAAPNQVSGAPDSGQFFGQLGTGLASLIAGHGHGAGNASGIIGVAPQAKILSVPVTLPSTDPLLGQTSVAAALPDDIAAGIRYAVAHGASVIDLPIDPGQPGASGNGGTAAAAGGSSAERAAVSYALSHNVVLVAPAGDDGSGSDAPGFPAAYPGVISVGAFDHDFVKTPWTSHQSYVTITAAGEDVVAAANDGGYQTLNSTSAAGAIVAGMAALIRSRYPGLSAAQVRQALISGTKFHGSTAGSGNGTADAQLALAAAAAEVPAGTPAGTGALPLVTQTAPAAAPRSLPATLLRDGIVSAALLVVLLLLIALYSAVSRRRTVRKQEAIAAEWTSRHPQSRYPHAGTEADRMLEYFAAPLQAPGAGQARPADKPARRKTPAFSGQGLFATAKHQPAATAASGRPITSRITGAPPTASPWDDADAVGVPPPALVSREVNKRPAVSGAPPWGPAVQPDSDLPWAAQDLDTGTSPAIGQASYAAPAQAIGQGAPGDRPAAIPPRAAGGPAGDAATPGSGALGPGTGALGPGTGALGPGTGALGPGSGPGRLGSGVPGAVAGGPGSAIAAARAGVAAAAQEAQARRGYAQPNLAPSGLGSPGPTSGSGSLWERSQPDRPSSIEMPAETTWPGRKPAGSGPTGPSTPGRLDWRRDLEAPSAAGMASPAAGFEPPGAQIPGPAPQPEYPPQQPDGPLPVRQPRRQAQPAPLSPSGSLWERAVDSPQQPAAGQDPGSHPMYVWSPGAPTESYPTTARDSGGNQGPRPAEQGSESASWDIQPPRDSQPQNVLPPRANRPPWDTQPPWDYQNPPWDGQS